MMNQASGGAERWGSRGAWDGSGIRQLSDSQSLTSAHLWLRRFAKLVAVATFFLIVAGGLVTSTDSGLSVPDWPLSYGYLIPPHMGGGIFYEHTHRMIAAFVGLLTIALALWLWFEEERRWVRWLGAISLLVLIAQGVLGGITVLYLLPLPISVMHACMAQTFFCLVVSLAFFTSNLWESSTPRIEASDAMPPKRLCLATAFMVYLQLILGALMRHMGAGLAIPDFPLAFGQLIPPISSPHILLNFAHRVMALLIAIFVAWTSLRIFRRYSKEPELLRLAVVMDSLFVLQILLGALTVWSQKAVLFATAHVAVGALLLAASLVATLFSYRIALPAERELHKAFVRGQATV